MMRPPPLPPLGQKVGGTCPPRPLAPKPMLKGNTVYYLSCNSYTDSSTDSWETYSKAKNFATFQVKKGKSHYEKKIVMQIKQNPKCFWKMVRDKTKVKEVISDFMSNKGEIIKDDKGKADILNSFFASVFTKEDKQNIPALQDRPFMIP